MSKNMQNIFKMHEIRYGYGIQNLCNFLKHEKKIS